MWNMKNALITVLAGATLATSGTVLVLEQGDTNKALKEMPTPTPTAIVFDFVASPEYDLPFDITEDYFIYTVKENDTLDIIANIFGISVEQLVELANLNISEELVVGQEIKIPRGK